MQQQQQLEMFYSRSQWHMYAFAISENASVHWYFGHTKTGVQTVEKRKRINEPASEREEMLNSGRRIKYVTYIHYLCVSILDINIFNVNICDIYCRSNSNSSQTCTLCIAIYWTTSLYNLQTVAYIVCLHRRAYRLCTRCTKFYTHTMHAFGNSSHSICIAASHGKPSKCWINGDWTAALAHGCRLRVAQTRVSMRALRHSLAAAVIAYISTIPSFNWIQFKSRINIILHT